MVEQNEHSIHYYAIYGWMAICTHHTMVMHNVITVLRFSSFSLSLFLWSRDEGGTHTKRHLKKAPFDACMHAVFHMKWVWLVTVRYLKSPPIPAIIIKGKHNKCKHFNRKTFHSTVSSHSTHIYHVVCHFMWISFIFFHTCLSIHFKLN